MSLRAMDNLNQLIASFKRFAMEVGNSWHSTFICYSQYRFFGVKCLCNLAMNNVLTTFYQSPLLAIVLQSLTLVQLPCCTTLYLQIICQSLSWNKCGFKIETSVLWEWPYTIIGQTANIIKYLKTSYCFYRPIRYTLEKDGILFIISSWPNQLACQPKKPSHKVFYSFL